MTAPQTIHLVFKTHLDIGFTDMARNVAARYFTDFIPRALDVAAELRRTGADRFRWTTGAWLIYEFLERASPAERAHMEQAIAAGDIHWHALPFTTHSELMDAELFAFGLSLAQRLDERFARRTIAAKMTDVPGHTRAIVPLLAQAGVQFLHLGVNGASTPPDVPPAFLWRDPSGAEVVVMYQRGGYGDFGALPGLGHALAFAHTEDNIGPQTAGQARASFARLRERFPNAEVIGSTLDAFAKQAARVKAQLPVVTGEIGDTWIHGVGSDPQKVARFRALSRLRNRWMANGAAQQHAKEVDAFGRALLMVPEHTWGMDIKMHLNEYRSYARAPFAAAREQANFRAFESSWAEQRAYLDTAQAALLGTPLAAEAAAVVLELAPRRPEAHDLRPLLRGETVTGAHFALALDPATGAIAQLIDRQNGRAWARSEHLLGLLRYQTFAQSDYDRFHRQYNINKRTTSRWSVPDFTKPGIADAGAESRWWLPRLVGTWHRCDGVGDYLLAELEFPPEAVANYGCPGVATLEITLPADARAVHWQVQWFEKAACRLPEALWFSFAPVGAAARGWELQKMGQQIAPDDVVRDGNRHLHAVEAVRYADERGSLRLDTPDAPLIAPGEPALLNFTNRFASLRGGVHVNLYNNVWGTNFPMWYEDDARFRFTLSFG